jgi:hypothetical protein
MEDESYDGDLSPRWWLDRGDAERAAHMLAAGDFVPTSEAEHQALCRELEPRGLVCVHDQGGTWVWTPLEAAELADGTPTIAGGGPPPTSITAELTAARRGARRGSGASAAGRSRSSR